MKKYTPLDGLRWSRNSDSALNNMPQTDVLGRAGGGKGKYSVRHLRFQSSLFNVALEMAFLIFATFSLAKA